MRPDAFDAQCLLWLKSALHNQVPGRLVVHVDDSHNMVKPAGIEGIGKHRRYRLFGIPLSPMPRLKTHDYFNRVRDILRQCLKTAITDNLSRAFELKGENTQRIRSRVVGNVSRQPLPALVNRERGETGIHHGCLITEHALDVVQVMLLEPSNPQVCGLFHLHAVSPISPTLGRCFKRPHASQPLRR